MFLKIPNHTLQKLPAKLYTAAQVRELDRIAIAEYAIPGYELMRRAGAEVFRLLTDSWPHAKSIAVLCGAGNNAGDGYIVAALALAQGFSVLVYSIIDPNLLTGDAKTAYQHYFNANGQVRHFQSGQAIDADIAVDAIFGTGLDRPVTGIYAEAIAAINKASAAVIAVDIPSGLHADTGQVMANVVRADQTISFIGLKQGLFTGQAADYCGEISYASLDVPDELFNRVQSHTVRVGYQAMPKRQRDAHKGCFGHVLIIGGDFGFSGAARLAGEAALRIGAGLVSIATRPEHAGLMNSARPELMCHGLDNPGQLNDLLNKVDVVVIGPGLGQSQWATGMFDQVLGTVHPVVMDADALNLLAQSAAWKGNWVLTPHPGEASRLLSKTTTQVQADRFKSATDLQTRYGGVAVLKGSGTLIASEAHLAVSNTGNPGMASGGMGDVLSGVIGGLLAQGLTLPQAAEQGVYLHGLAADLAVAEAGERGLLASDLMAYLRLLVNQ